MRVWLHTLLIALVLAPAWAQEPETEARLLICYPRAPGTTRSAEPVMERLGAYLSERGSPQQPTYFNDAEVAGEWLSRKRPRYAILSLALFLRWREEHGLVAIASSERAQATHERFHLLVRQDAQVKELADLLSLGRPAKLWSSHLDDPRFASRVVFQGKLEISATGPVRSVATSQPLRALRRLKTKQAFEGQPVDAVLVDGVTWRGLQQLKSFQGVLRVLYSSPPLPTPPVVALEGASKEETETLRQALFTMHDDPLGKKLLKTLQLARFKAAEPKALDAVVAAYQGSK